MVAHSKGMWPLALGNPVVASAMHAMPLVVWLRPVSRDERGRRAERGGVPVGVGEPVLRQPVDVRGLDQPTPGLHGGEADVVENDVEDARRPRRRHRLEVGLPVGGRVPIVDVDDTFERLAHCWFPFDIANHSLRRLNQTRGRRRPTLRGSDKRLNRSDEARAAARFGCVGSPAGGSDRPNRPLRKEHM